ncbi:MAG: PP2C family protein-serine/threonine phosphatase [Terracidiphilus sp.]|nr:PP2C family protein-serine/threonine phosphatase [Terracidiphilus sp.]MDR3798258.1 PP2C family protein-serine/threonine phosphatase [Terracidiphilus sp.]
MLFPTSLRHSRRLAGICVFAFLGLLLLPRAPLWSQTFDATTLRQPTDLGVVWLIKAGDDASYARGDFDDSQWTRLDTNQSLKQFFPAQHPSVIWYRLHIKVAPNETGLSLEEFNLSSAFEIYVNGERLFANGSVSPYHPYGFQARVVKRIPDAMIATGSVVIAMRLYVSSNEWVSSFPGFYPYNLTIGQETALSDHVWLTIIGDNLLEWFYEFAGLGLGIIAFALFTAQRQQREYLWIFLLFLAAAVHAPFKFYQLFHNLPTWSSYIDGGFNIAGLVLQTLMFLAFLRMPLKRWLQALLVVSAIGILFGSWQTASGTGSSIGVLLSVTPELSLIAGIIPILLIVRWRRGNHEAGILLVPAVVASLSIYVQLGIFIVSMIPEFAGPAFHLQKAIFNWTAGPFTISANNIDGCLFVLSLAVILVLRSTRIAHQQAHLETEMAAAREVQQIILPEQLEHVPGFSIESAYVPAQQVGGDFFQILPAAEGSLLLVIGDVAGKGLPAAMLVSVLVGAIRGVAEYTSEPAELLANLNQRLVGRVAGNFSTALAAHIFSDGSVVLSNAGHLPPYLDGQEVAISGALPLGAKAGTRYETMRFQMPRGSRLTFYSDGIVEAQDAKGELFGFERSRQISMEPVAAIVEAAKQFGQQDDMTVIAITRDAAAVRDAQAQKASVAAPALAN